MTYNLNDNETIPVVVVETPVFLRQSATIWSEEERAIFIDFIAHNPEMGAVIRGTGGIRKIRWQTPGSGKRGGARVIYFYYHPDAPIYLLLAYTKAKQEDMTQDGKQKIVELSRLLKEQHPSKGQR